MRISIFLFSVLTILSTLTIACAGISAQVVINEFMADPARDWDGDGQYNYRDDEWVEILNLGESVVDLFGYRISDGEGDPVWRYGFSGLLGPGEMRIVFGSESEAWEESNSCPVYGLSLNNSGDRVSLYYLNAGETLLVDAFSYEAKAAEDDRSVGRNPGAVDTWSLFDAFNPCSGSCVPSGNGCIPTPGSRNDCTTDVGVTSWGSIKSKYRGVIRGSLGNRNK